MSRSPRLSPDDRSDYNRVLLALHWIADYGLEDFVVTEKTERQIARAAKLSQVRTRAALARLAAAEEIAVFRVNSGGHDIVLLDQGDSRTLRYLELEVGVMKAVLVNPGPRIGMFLAELAAKPYPSGPPKLEEVDEIEA